MDIGYWIGTTGRALDLRSTGRDSISAQSADNDILYLHNLILPQMW